MWQNAENNSQTYEHLKSHRFDFTDKKSWELQTEMWTWLINNNLFICMTFCLIYIYS